MLKERNVQISPQAESDREMGIDYHVQHGRTIQSAGTIRWVGILLILLACMLALIYFFRSIRFQ
jgi:hypothetical protein